ncbi:MAG TPA: hypothetical protein PKW79_02475 [Rhabdochlamydiaceae bacterium]|nr:hypothetical protein [Rhabdochlamydiaceae bacterium]
MASYDIGSIIGNFSIKGWVSDHKLGQQFETGFVKPVAKCLAENSVDRRTDNRSEIVQSLQDNLEYDIKANVFNVATICAVAYAALALLGAMSLIKATNLISVCYIIREVANQSLALSESSTIQGFAERLAGYFKNMVEDDQWQPDYLSWSDVCILKNPSISLDRQFGIAKRALFG